jgi:hypothetical protein
VLLFLAVLTVLLVPTLASPVHQAHAASSPDLTVDNIWLEENSNPGQPVTQVTPGDQFLIVASIKNLGTANASGYYLDVYYDSDFGRGGPDTIVPGETQIWLVGPLTAQAGTHTTKWIVDSDNQIAESNEANNERDYTFTIGSQTTNTTSTTTSMTTSSSTTTSTTGTTTASTESSSTFSQTVAPKTITSNGGVSIDTSQSKFGGASGLFDGTDDGLSLGDSADWAFGTGDFTIDTWISLHAPTKSRNCIFQQYADSTHYQFFYVRYSSPLYYLVYQVYDGSQIIYSAQTISGPSADTWHHVALVRTGNDFLLFLDGTKVGSTVTDTDAVPDFAAAAVIGNWPVGTAYDLNGWLDEFRVSKGVARWTSNFTPPTAPYSREGQTVLLLHMDGTNGSTTFLDDVTVVTTTTTSSTTSTTSTSTTSATSTTTSFPVTVSIIVTANPVGSIVVDGTTYTSQQTFTWVPGSSHTITANSPVLGDSGTQYAWTSWADGGDQSRTITTPSSDTAYLANYQTQYQVTYSQTGCGLPVSVPATEWVNAGGSAVGVFPSTVTSSDGKTQCLLQNASPSGPINAPAALAATYKTQYYLTVMSSYGNSTGQGWYDAGSNVTFAVTSPAGGGAGTQYAFTGWASSDTGGYTGADSSHSFTVNSPITETASWKTQWEVTFAVNPSGGGAITVSGQPSATAWYDDGAVITIQASPNTGCAYASWSSDTASIVFTDSSALTAVTIHGSGTITANFLLADTTVPVITPAVAPTANSNSWNNVPVTVSWSVSDPESGIASSNGCAMTTLNNETPLEGTTLTCTVANNAGLSNSASVTVKIDLTAPTLTLPSPTVEATGPGGVVVSYDASASDSLSGLDTFSCTPPSGSTFPMAATAVSCSATDKAGNYATSVFTVTVQDKTAPVVTVPADITVGAAGPSGAVVTFTTSASDLVDGSVPVTCTPASGSTFPGGTTVVTCSAVDKAGNYASASFKVTVRQVTIKLLSSNGNGLSGAVVQYYSGGWKAFGTTGSDGTVSMALSPATYSFKISYAGASQQKSQNGATNANVVFQTVQVHSDSGKCTSYYASGWRTFTQDMELLPGTYTFRFSDKTKNTSYTLVVGAVKHIH